MRKDVKIGLAIAGVLFAVLIVYVFVPKGDTNNTASNGDNTDQTTDDNNTGDVPGAPTDGGGIPPTDTGATPPVDPGVAARDVFAPGNNAADPGSASADAGSTDWTKTFDTGVVASLAAPEAHPPLVAIGTSPGAAVTDPDHGPGNAAPPVIPSVSETPGAVADAGNTVTPGGVGPVVPPVSPDSGTSMAPRTGSSPVTVSAPGVARTHVMQPGETFSSVAKAVYGKSSYYLKIQKANPTVNPNAVKVGTVINLPDASTDTASPTRSSTPAGSARGAARESAAPAVNSASEYRIQPGDSLYKISVKLYGTGGHVDELYETNAAAIGDDPARLKVGMVLKLHDAPRVQR